MTRISSDMSTDPGERETLRRVEIPNALSLFPCFLSLYPLCPNTVSPRGPKTSQTCCPWQTQLALLLWTKELGMALHATLLARPMGLASSRDVALLIRLARRLGQMAAILTSTLHFVQKLQPNAVCPGCPQLVHFLSGGLVQSLAWWPAWAQLKHFIEPALGQLSRMWPFP